MAYTIFISHTQNDQRIAETIKRVINDAFEGSIKFFLAVHDLGGGDAWKDAIKDRLKDCDAVITLLTEHSIAKPWIFIEWSAFWVNDKAFYTLATEEVRVSSLVDPMRDRQSTTVTDTDQVRSFFRSLARDSNHKKGIPFDFVDDFVIGVKQAIAERDEELAMISYARFRQSLVDLPREDSEKRKIAEWFYRQEEIDVAKRITYEIRDDLIKAEMASQLIRVGDLDNARLVIETIRAADRLAFVARAYIDYGYIDARVLKTIIEDIAKKNQAEMRTLCIYLIGLGQIDTELFNFIVSSFTNMAELRKIGEHIIENQMVNDVADSFNEIVLIIASKNQKEVEKLLTHLLETNQKLVEEYLAVGLITNTNSRLRLERLLGNN